MGSLADRLRVAAVGDASSWDAGEIAIAPVAPSPLAPAPVPAAAVHLISRSASPEFDGGFWDDGVVGDGLGWVLRKNRVAAWFPELKARERRRKGRGDVGPARADEEAAEAEWLRRRRERDEAARLANRVLDFMRVDPDGDLAILARAFLRDH